MSLKTEIQPYIDSEGLVSPGIPTGSNNGVMYTSEYIVMLIRNGEATEADIDAYLTKMESCFVLPGLLGRHLGGTGDQEGPDDYLGLAAALHEINNDRSKAIARSVVTYAIEHIGDMNNPDPGHFAWGAFLGRQPQLGAVFLWASGLPVGPLVRFYCAMSILLSCKGLPANSTDPRRLSWLLIQVAASKSWICKLASIVWYRRLYGVYPTGMKGVAQIYYQSGHPFSKYWIDKA